jgi:hypothetical protein
VNRDREIGKENLRKKGMVRMIEKEMQRRHR